jgi:NADPH-dependent 2,4-dienoyl-CoA reductase/sulfur reductase-like enzyme
MAGRLVVLGADAAGMSAAHQALRTAKAGGRELEVVALERTEHTSYSACGIPYWLAGDVGGADDLVARSPNGHRERGVDLRTGATATGVDLAARTVGYDDAGGSHELGFDQLLLATGAHPIVPDWATGDDGSPYTGVGALKNLDDGTAWLARLEGDRPREVVIAGGGYLGVEMAETALRRGHEVTLLTRSRVMHNLDAELGARIVKGMVDAGATVVERAEVLGLEVGADGAVRAAEATTGRYQCDLLVLALGVVPSTEFLAGSGLPLMRSGGLRPDPHGIVGDGVRAAGDCCEVRHRVTGAWEYLPLGTHANKMGRAAGDSLAGGDLRFDGVLGTAITRFAVDGTHLEISRTGLGQEQATAAGLDAVSLVTEGTTASGYMPEADPVAIQVTAERGSRRLLGAQVVGGRGASKRVDAVAAALWGGMSVDDLAWMDLSYAPPFATAWEVVSIAARRLAERL